jgi:hypothetical protein
MGAAPDKSYESYLSALGLIDDLEKMDKESKERVAMQAHDNASKVLDYYKKMEQGA